MKSQTIAVEWVIMKRSVTKHGTKDALCATSELVNFLPVYSCSGQL